MALRSIDELATRVSAKAPGLGATSIEFPNHRIQGLVERSIGAGTKRRQSRDDAIEMRGQRFLPARRLFGALTHRCWQLDARRTSLAIPTARRHSSKASSTSASQNSIRTGRRRGPFA